MPEYLQYLFNVQLTSTYLSDKECLVLVTAMRKFINQCGLKPSDIDLVVKETSILESLRLFFALEQTSVYRTQIRLEATWVALNLAMGSVVTIEALCSQEYRLFQQINSQLGQSNDDMLLHSIWFMGNVLVENQMCCAYVLNKSDTIEAIERIAAMKIQDSVSERLAEISTWFVQ